MSIPAFAWALEQGCQHDLKPAERLVLVYMADQADRYGRFHTGQPTIRKYTGLAMETVRTAIKRLASLRLIRMEPREGLPTIYHVLVEDNPILRSKARGANGHTPPKYAVVTPPNGVGVGELDPPKSPPEPPQITTGPPPNGCPDPLSTQVENPKTRAGAREEGKGSEFFEEEGKEGIPSSPPRPVEREPTQAEVMAERDRQLAELGEMAPLATAMARRMFTNYPPRAAVRTVNEMRDAAAPIARRPSAAVSAEHLAAMRHAAGYGAQAP